MLMCFSAEARGLGSRGVPARGIPTSKPKGRETLSSRDPLPCPLSEKVRGGGGSSREDPGTNGERPWEKPAGTGGVRPWDGCPAGGVRECLTTVYVFCAYWAGLKGGSGKVGIRFCLPKQCLSTSPDRQPELETADLDLKQPCLGQVWCRDLSAPSDASFL